MSASTERLDQLTEKIRRGEQLSPAEVAALREFVIAGMRALGRLSEVAGQAAIEAGRAMAGFAKAWEAQERPTALSDLDIGRLGA